MLGECQVLEHLYEHVSVASFYNLLNPGDRHTLPKLSFSSLSLTLPGRGAGSGEKRLPCPEAGCLLTCGLALAWHVREVPSQPLAGRGSDSAVRPRTDPRSVRCTLRPAELVFNS